MRCGALSGDVHVLINRPKFQNAHHERAHTQDTQSAPHRKGIRVLPHELSHPSQERKPLDQFERIRLAPAKKVVPMKLQVLQAMRVGLTYLSLLPS